MFSRLFAYFQYILPQHFLTYLAGKLAESKQLIIKNFVINQFVKNYNVDMSEAVIENPNAYTTFNDFFIRQLKPGLRTITPEHNSIASPVDGSVAQIGNIRENQLLQAKNAYFDLETLLGGDTDLAKKFYDGSFATLYLAPNNYHRIHMPISGTLKQTIYVPGKLFSVNKMTSDIIPNLYSRNERYVCIFDTEIGQMAVILVGALIVGSIKTVWLDQPIKCKNIINQQVEKYLAIAKGDELGYFKLGSTVIVLFEKNKMTWSADIKANCRIQVGELVGMHITHSLGNN